MILAPALILAVLPFGSDKSFLVRPIYLDPVPPTLRSARHLLLHHVGSLGAPESTQRTREEALDAARAIAEWARTDRDFEELVRTRSEDPDALRGGILGSFAPGMLAPALDEFLFASEMGAISPPLVDERGVHVLQRVETRAAVQQIVVSRTRSDAKRCCEELAARARDGEDFSVLARHGSDVPESAARGGDFAIYVRSRADVLLKEVAFRLAEGEISRPVESPFGWHQLRRVPLEGFDRSLEEPSFVRLRGILIGIDEDSLDGRDTAQALDLASRILARLEKGEDMISLAREFDEDSGGRQRAGDLGWILRTQPDLAPPLQRACLLRKGDIAPPTRIPQGYVILRRER
jgi:parvulin-like peptidyl-prolyl isomerase